jgi:uncharacterized protein
VLAICAASDAADPLPPELTQPVNDFAHVIDAQSAASLDHMIRGLKSASGDVIVVATIDTFAPYADIRAYALKMFENHGRGIGDKGKDNGLLVLVAVKDRKVWNEVGYDLEQFITDGYAGEVSRTAMTPAFARGDYGGGLVAGVSQFVSRIAQARNVTLPDTIIPPASVPSAGGGGWLPLVLLFLFSRGGFITLIILFMVFSRLTRRSRTVGGRRRWGGGPWSGWNSGVGPFGGGGGFGGGGFGGGFGGFGGGRSGGGGGGAGW